MEGARAARAAVERAVTDRAAVERGPEPRPLEREAPAVTPRVDAPEVAAVLRRGRDAEERPGALADPLEEGATLATPRPTPRAAPATA